MKPDTSHSRYLPARKRIGTALFDFALLAIVGLVIAFACFAGLGHIHP